MLSPGNHFLELPPEKGGSDFVLHYVEAALPLSPTTNERLRGNLRVAILKGMLTVYLGLRVKESGQEEITAIMTVLRDHDVITETKTMTIYTLTAIRELTPELVREGMEFVRIKARLESCQRIIAFTEAESIAKIAGVLGGKTATTVVWEV